MMTFHEFTPRRLTIARQIRRMTKKALAAKVGLTAQSITGFESGDYVPRDEIIDLFVAHLEFPRLYFFAEEIEEIQPSCISFRSLRSATAGLRDKMKASGEVAACCITPALERTFRLPVTDVPDLSREDPETAAELLRSMWGLGQGPISNMVSLLEHHGVQMFWTDEDAPMVDALSFWWGKRPFVILSQRCPAGERGRFDAAHELGHLVLHQNVEQLDSENTEHEANQFASAFLLPRAQFRAECERHPTLSDYLDMKERWKVSIQAMIRRSKDINILTKWQYQSAFQDLSVRGWRRDEPGRLPREESSVHAQVFESYARKNATAEDFAATVYLKIDLLCELMPVAMRYRLEPIPETESLESLYGTLEDLGYTWSGNVEDVEDTVN
jgi:Zn-dependent peptidase ImmA (M78 family)/DNA-binding XRE family transcriptional regulator